MSKHINVNPGQYKVAGRERQGEDIVHDLEKREKEQTPRHDERQQRHERSIAKQAHGSAANPGISNRMSADEEAQDQREHPPVDTSSPPPQDAAGRVGEEPLEDRRDRHTSHKAGSRSIAQKEAGTKYPDRSMPAAHKVAGAFGREPRDRQD
jgi:hypothetical protein